MITLPPVAAIVKPADLESTIPAVLGNATSEFTQADYREYDAWLEANADELAAEAEAYESYEQGYPTW